MPYRRRPYKAKRYRRNNLVTRSQLARTQRIAWKNEHPLQWYDYDVAVSPTSTVATVDLLNLLISNVDAFREPLQRTPNGETFIYVDHIMLQLRVHQVDSLLFADDDWNNVRFAIFKDTTGSSSTAVDVLTGIDDPLDTDTVITTYVDALRYLKRVSISDTEAVPAQSIIKRNIRVKDKFQYIGGTTALTGTIQKSIKWQYISDSTVSPHPAIDGFMRIYYRML